MFSDAQNEVLQALIICGSCLSIVGTLFITLSYVVFPSLRSFPYKIIVFLGLADFFNALSYLIGLNSELCQLQAAMSQFFAVATFFWTACFAYNIVQVLVYQHMDVSRNEPYYHMVSWGVPAVLLVINLALDSFGDGVVWCWISADHPYLRFLTFYLPLLAIVCFNAVVYVVVSRSLRGDLKRGAVKRRLNHYLFVFLLVRLWSVVNRFQNFLDPNGPIFFLYFMHTLFSPLQGFCNAVVYGLNMQVRQHYREMLCLDSARDTRSASTLGNTIDTVPYEDMDDQS
eukprot:TRINITY_DN66462_c7_g1_i1.p1 TRINITY_DN66462_c7_g1~~TRINITY_DN66462_c7_g1_i1.p1  ORF type:complete len:285 (-),score=121.11 TRINITY_DN66462_c7_g1_i1:715-1569(-)